MQLNLIQIWKFLEGIEPHYLSPCYGPEDWVEWNRLSTYIESTWICIESTCIETTVTPRIVSIVARTSLLKMHNFSMFPADPKWAFCLLFNFCKATERRNLWMWFLKIVHHIDALGYKKVKCEILILLRLFLNNNLLVHAYPDDIPPCGGSWLCFVKLLVILLDESLTENRLVLTLVTMFSSNGFYGVFLSLVMPHENKYLQVLWRLGVTINRLWCSRKLRACTYFPTKILSSYSRYIWSAALKAFKFYLVHTVYWSKHKLDTVR